MQSAGKFTRGRLAYVGRGRTAAKRQKLLWFPMVAGGKKCCIDTLSFFFVVFACRVHMLHPLRGPVRSELIMIVARPRAPKWQKQPASATSPICSSQIRMTS